MGRGLWFNFREAVVKMPISYFQNLVKIATAGTGLPSVK
jgi:hypothetical protein